MANEIIFPISYEVIDDNDGIGIAHRPKDTWRNFAKVIIDLASPGDDVMTLAESTNSYLTEHYNATFFYNKQLDGSYITFPSEEELTAFLIKFSYHAV